MLVVAMLITAVAPAPVGAQDSAAASPLLALVAGDVAADAIVQYGGWTGQSRHREETETSSEPAYNHTVREIDFTDLVFRRAVQPEQGPQFQHFVLVDGMGEHRYQWDTGGGNTLECVTTGRDRRRVRFETTPRDTGLSADERRGFLWIHSGPGETQYTASANDPRRFRVRQICERREPRTRRPYPEGAFLRTQYSWTRPTVVDPLRLHGEAWRMITHAHGRYTSYRTQWDLRATTALAADMLGIPSADAPDAIDVFLRIQNRGTMATGTITPPDTLGIAGDGVAHQVAGPEPAAIEALAPGTTAAFHYRVEVDQEGPLTFTAEAQVRDTGAEVTFPIWAEGGLSLVVNDDGDAGLDGRHDACDTDPDREGNQCTLRAAIELANALPGRNRVTFDGVTRVRPSSGLPEIENPVVIDGSVAGGGRVELDGRDAGQASGLHVTGGGSTIRGMVIHSFTGSGIVLDTSGGNVVVGNVVGLTRDGTCPRVDPTTGACRGNGDHGILVLASDGNTIGGLREDEACAGPCNVVSGNAKSGIAIIGGGQGATETTPLATTGNGNRILGNMIGVDADGSCGDHSPTDGCRTGNGQAGVLVDTASRTVVGGILAEPWTCVAACNVISANRLHGVVITGPPQTAAMTRVQGNFIGTDRSGDCTRDAQGHCKEGNLGLGVLAAGGLRDDDPSDDTLVGGGLPGEGNLIGGNGVAGVGVVGQPSGDVLVAGNRIGTDPSGTRPVANGTGILLDSAQVSIGEGTVRGAPDGSIVVGGPSTPGACDQRCNVISGNRVSGITIRDQEHRSAATIAGNLIGTDARGTAALPNGASGIEASRGGFLAIGGGPLDGWNVISGNRGTGISITDSDPSRILHSFVGTDAQGTRAVPNGSDGIAITRTIVSVGTAQGCDPVCNVVSGNAGSGIVVVGVTGTLRDGPELFAMCICGNRVGTDRAGKEPLGNGKGGIVVGTSTTIDIGAPTSGNVVSANREAGISLDGSTDILVRANRVGTAADGTCARDRQERCPLGNANVGVYLRDTSGSVVGGSKEGEGNVVAGNAHGQRLAGIAIGGTRARGNRVVGNLVGLAANGRTVVPNGGGGVWLLGGASDNVVGGARRAQANVIAGNGPACRCPAVWLQGAGTERNRILGNRIGTLADGKTEAPNHGHGIGITRGAARNLIGGEKPGEGNVIAFNGTARGYDGVRVSPDAGPGNDIRGNRIFDNLGLGIDLGRDGVTLDDEADADEGGNDVQNAPLLLSAKGETIRGVATGRPGATIRIDLYATPECDGGPFGSGEGRDPYASVDVALGPGGEAEFRAPIEGRGVFTATATDGGSTSEFSRCIERGEVVDATDTDGDGVTDAIEDAARPRGDGNADGTPDRQQPTVASVPSSIDGRFLVVVAPDGTVLTRVRTIDQPSPDDAPTDLVFPHGFVELAVRVDPGASLDLGVRLPAAVRDGRVWVWAEPESGIAGGWSAVDDAEVKEDRVRAGLVDGGTLDPDGAADGWLRVTIGVGVPAAD